MMIWNKKDKKTMKIVIGKKENIVMNEGVPKK
jgi:hypothetical protein